MWNSQARYILMNYIGSHQNKYYVSCSTFCPILIDSVAFVSYLHYHTFSLQFSLMTEVSLYIAHGAEQPIDNGLDANQGRVPELHIQMPRFSLDFPIFTWFPDFYLVAQSSTYNCPDFHLISRFLLSHTKFHIQMPQFSLDFPIFT